MEYKKGAGEKKGKGAEALKPQLKRRKVFSKGGDRSRLEKKPRKLEARGRGVSLVPGGSQWSWKGFLWTRETGAKRRRTERKRRLR